MKRLLAFFAILTSLTLILVCVVFAPRLILAAMVTGVLWMFWGIAGDIIEYIEMKERRKRKTTKHECQK